MLKNIIISTFISAIVIMMSACGEAPKPVTKQLIKVQPIKITFPKVDPITEEKISLNNLNLTTFITKLSKYKRYRHVSSYKSLRYYQGLKIEDHKNIISISYINELIASSLHEESKATFDFLYEKQDNILIFKYPVSYTYIREGSFPVRPLLDSLENLEADSKNIFSQLKNLSLDKKYKLIGEINSDFPAKSIYANFKRMLGNYSYRENVSESKKQSTFKLTIKDQYIPLHIEVFPYREGSKVKYSALIPYKISQEGSTLSKQDIASIKEEIKKIVND